MPEKSAFFNFFNRREAVSFDRFMAESTEDVDYIDWNGYVLPMHYGDAEQEYNAIRHSCGIFDGTPFRKVRIHGRDAGSFLDHLVTRPVSGLASMRAAYVVFCNDDGSLKDDSVLFKFSDEDYLIMPSDIDHIPYFESLQAQLGVSDVMFSDETYTMTGLAIQGPGSAAAVIAMGFDGVENLKPFEVRAYDVDGTEWHISRTGFTADLGYECWLPIGQAQELCRRVDLARTQLGLDIPGYGLSAVQACRLEGSFIVAGWDCSTEADPDPGFERSPFELGLGWLVDLEGAPFVGRDALADQKRAGIPNLLRNIVIDTREAPADGTILLDGNGDDANAIGIVACSTWCWGQDAVIGNASIKSAFADRDSAWIDIDGRCLQVTLGRGPLVNLARRNDVPASVELDPGGL